MVWGRIGTVLGLRYLWIPPALLCAGQAYAAPNAADALRTLEPPSREVLQLPREVLPSSPVEPSEAQESGPKIYVARFAIDGVEAAQRPPAQLLAGFEGRELSFADLQRVAISVTQHYRQQGWLLAQAYLPPQDVEGGVVRIVVLPGELDNIEVVPGDGARLGVERARARLLQAVEPGQPLQADALERSLLLLDDLPGVRAQAALAPGGRVGTSNLDVQLLGQPLLAGSLQLDNYGLQSTGEHRLGGELVLADPLGIGDRLGLRALTAEDDGLANAALSYDLPLNSQGTRLNSSLSYLEYELGEEFRALDGFGRATVLELGISHPLLRQRRHSLYLQGGYAHKRLTDVLDAVDSNSRKRIDLFTLGATYERLDSWGGYNSLSLAYSQGHLGLLDDAGQLLDSAPGGLGRAGHFAKLNASLMRLQPLAPQWSLYLGLSGQRALDNLDSVEKFSLGGPYALRAYPSGEATGDHGWLAVAELQWQVRPWLMLGLFSDFGWVQFDQQHSPLDSGPYDRHLRSTGLTARLGQGSGPRLSASLAWPGGDDSQVDPGQSQPRGFVALSYHF